MNWKLLVQAAETHHRKYPDESSHRFYDEYFEDRNDSVWWSEDEPSEAEVRRLFKFLNQWKCRLRANSDDISRFSAIAPAVGRTLAPLRNGTLGDFDLDESSVAAVARAFEVLLGTFWRRNSTAASKAIHAYNRDLLLPWDQSIRSSYGIDGSAASYARLFLPRMQREVREAVATFARDMRVPVDEVPAELERRCDGRPLAKVMDEYNILKYRDGEPGL